MNFTEVLQELPSLNFEQRQILIRCALEIDDLPLKQADEAIVISRLTALRENPSSALSFEEIESSLRSRYGK